MSSSTLLRTILATVLVCFIVQVADSKVRRRRQYTYSNYGANELQPVIPVYDGTIGSDSYIGNNRLQNTLIASERVYQYPTPINVMSGGSYNPGQYDTYPDRGRDYYSNFNDMRLPTSNTWNSRIHSESLSNRFLSNAAQFHSSSSPIIKLLFIFIACIICVRIL